MSPAVPPPLSCLRLRREGSSGAKRHQIFSFVAAGSSIGSAYAGMTNPVGATQCLAHIFGTSASLRLCVSPFFFLRVFAPSRAQSFSSPRLPPTLLRSFGGQAASPRAKNSGCPEPRGQVFSPPARVAVAAAEAAWSSKPGISFFATCRGARRPRGQVASESGDYFFRAPSVRPARGFVTVS